MEQRWLFVLLSVSLVGILVSVVAAQSASGSVELNLGVQAYRHAKYDEAIQHFEKAVNLDPANAVAHLYLAVSYAQQYIPGADTPDNIKMGDRAIQHYKKVIDLDFSKGATVDAVKGIAYLQLQMKRFEEAKDYYRRATELDPEDPEPYYSIGVIDWTETYQPRQEERAGLGLKPEDSLPAKDRNVCLTLREKNWAKIQDGIDNLSTALQLRHLYDDAMAYMNLMYRERADLQCDDPVAREADLKMADAWVDKTMAAKKIKAEKQGAVPAPKQ